MNFKSFDDFVAHLKITGAGGCTNPPDQVNTGIFNQNKGSLIHPQSTEYSVLGRQAIQVSYKKLREGMDNCRTWETDVPFCIRTHHLYKEEEVIKIMPCDLFYSQDGNLIAVKGDLVGKKTRLPKKGQWELLISFGGKKGDDFNDLFTECTLPPGWTTAAENMYWTNIYDARGLLRGNYFEKITFYDKDAFLNISESRFVVIRDFSHKGNIYAVKDTGMQRSVFLAEKEDCIKWVQEYIREDDQWSEYYDFPEVKESKVNN